MALKFWETKIFIDINLSTKFRQNWLTHDIIHLYNMSNGTKKISKEKFICVKNIHMKQSDCAWAALRRGYFLQKIAWQMQKIDLPPPLSFSLTQSPQRGCDIVCQRSVHSGTNN
jgi:hypothetical protein